VTAAAPPTIPSCPTDVPVAVLAPSDTNHPCQTDKESSQADFVNGLLGICLARALPRNPSTVLRVTDLANEDGALGVNRVCGVPFIETTRAYNNAYKRRTIPAVGRVRDPTLAMARAKCLARLKSS